MSDSASRSLTIWIDADACPREIKEIVFRASKRLGIPVVLVANQPMGLTGQSLIRCVVVREGANMADKHIVEQAGPGDIVITADIPLAAQLVAKEVHVIDPRGQAYDANNVATRLGARDLLDAARGAGLDLSGPAPFSMKDRGMFASTFDRILTRALQRK